MFAVVLLLWIAFGFKLAFRKGQRGARVDWIGNNIAINRDWVHVTITDEFMREFRAATHEISQVNVVSEKQLRSYTGAASHVANLVWALRPFLDEFWAAISSLGDKSRSNAPPNCIWRKQIDTGLSWIQAFLKQEQGTLTRSFSLNAFLYLGDAVEFTFDASPWGLGGFVSVNGAPKFWFADLISEFDVLRFGYGTGDHAGQQTWEALAALCGLRAWASLWKNGRSRLHVKRRQRRSFDVDVAFKILWCWLQIDCKGTRVGLRGCNVRAFACFTHTRRA